MFTSIDLYPSLIDSIATGDECGQRGQERRDPAARGGSLRQHRPGRPPAGAGSLAPRRRQERVHAPAHLRQEEPARHCKVSD